MTYKRASFLFLSGVTGLLCLVAILCSTPWGAQLSIFAVNEFSPIQVKYKSGSILNNLTLKQLTIENDVTVINADNIRLTLHLRCLWKSQLCIDEISINSLQMKLKETRDISSDELVEQAINSSSFTLPFSVDLKKLILANAQIIGKGLVVNLTDFSSALSVKQSSINNIAINIQSALLAKAQIILTEPQNFSSKPIPVVWPLSSMPELYSPLKLTFKSLAIKTVNVERIDTTGIETKVITIDDTVARLSWFKTELFIEELTSTVAKSGTLSLKGKIDFVTPYIVDLTLVSSIENFELLPELNDSNQKVTINGNLSDLVTTIKSEGELALTAEMAVNVTDANLPYKLIANVTKLSLPDNINKTFTPSTFLLASEGDLNHHFINFKSKISGFGYQDAVLDINATYAEQTFKINTLHFEELNANNHLDMTGELQLGERLIWNVTVKSSGITLPNIDEKLSGRLQGNIISKGFYAKNEWAIALADSNVKGEINNIPLNVEANIDINHKGDLAPSKINLDYGDIILSLNGYSDKDWHIDGAISFGNTGLWIKDIESDLRSNISITGPIKQPKVTLNGEFKNLLMADFSSDAINFDVIYQPMNNHKHKVTFKSDRVNWHEHKVDSVNWSSHGDLSDQKVNIAWLGDSSIDLLINSHYSPQADQWKVATDKISFSLGEYDFESNKPLDFLYDNVKKTFIINQHCWLAAQSELCLKNDSSIKLAQGELALAIKLNADLLTPFIPEDIRLKSMLAGNVAIGWKTNQTPSVNAELVMSHGNVQINREDNLYSVLEWQKGQLNLKLDQNIIDGNFVLFSSDNTEIVKLRTSILFDENRIIESQLIINDLNISPLQMFIPELTSLEGTLNSRFTVVGDLGKPVIKGEVSLIAGKATILGNINTLEDISMAVDFKDQEAVITGGLNINKAAARVKGEADWQNEFKATINFDGESLKFSLPPDLTLTVSPHLHAQIQASELKISGRIEVLEGKISVDKLPQGSVSLSKDVIIVDDEGEQISNDNSFDIVTNVRVIIADTFNVEGQGFIGRLGGELQVSQQANQPLQLFGSLKIPEGRYSAYGQDLSVTKGVISFNGTANNPYVTIQATRSIEQDNVVVGIDATGLVNSLNIKLFSKPTMQQSETLSYLVRGRGLDAGTSDSNMAIGIALGSAITNFSGVLTQIERLPLINRIEIDGDDKQASIAGYLGDQVYIKYGIGIIEPINELTVRFYFLSRLWVETVSGLENSADIYYSFDIN
ncbi:MAG: translocation/assembly module TamB domain-containing protein [Colwellia sp.]|nr:translocation/assembly module TamB domain-containing protein [Colwellia sp.]